MLAISSSRNPTVYTMYESTSVTKDTLLTASVQMLDYPPHLPQLPNITHINEDAHPFALIIFILAISIIALSQATDAYIEPVIV